MARKIKQNYNLINMKKILRANKIVKQKCSFKPQRLRRYEKRKRFYRQNKISKTNIKNSYGE